MQPRPPRKSTDQRCDELLLKLLKTPPQPRPKRERGQPNPIQNHVSCASARKREPSAYPALATMPPGRCSVSVCQTSARTRHLQNRPAIGKMITAADFVAEAVWGQADGQNQIVLAQTRRNITQDKFKTRLDKYTYR
jgi:hypothetical protein